MQSGASLVLLDGLDEISNTEERKEVCRWIDGTWSGFGQAFFVVTSRATGYLKEEGIELEVDHERADVQDFTPAQQAMNTFLKAHKVQKNEQKLINNDNGAWWCFCV